MTDKDYKQTKKRIDTLITKWYKPGGWGWWRTDFCFSDERQPKNDDTCAETHADFKYSHATITFYVPTLVDKDDEELESILVHELCHLTASTFPNFEDNDDAVARFERTVDDFSRHIIWASEHVKEKKREDITPVN